MPNPRKDNVRINARIDRDLLAKLRLYRPELFQPSLTEIQFKHGGVSRYITLLINQDLFEQERPSMESPSPERIWENPLG